MFRLIITVSVLSGVFGIPKLYKHCIDTFTTAVSNEYLLGTWHRVYEFDVLGYPFSDTDCLNITYSIPSAEQLRTYKEKYDNAGFPFTLGNKSLLFEFNKGSRFPMGVNGMYQGEAGAKYSVMEPTPMMIESEDSYSVDVYERINNDFFIYWSCEFGAFSRRLMARNKSAPLEQLTEIIDAHPLLRDKTSKRLCAPKRTSGLLELFKECIDAYNNVMFNKYLLGTWHQMYEFKPYGFTLASSVCPNITFSFPTADELKTYKDKYDKAEYPFKLDKKSMIFERNKGAHFSLKGLCAAETQARYYVLDPKNAMVLNEHGFEVEVRERISKNYMIEWSCSNKYHRPLRLMARNKDAPLDELQEIIDTHPELKKLDKQRYCVPDNMD